MWIRLDEVPSMPREDLETLFRDHCGQGFYKLLKFSGLGVRFVRAFGCSLWDENGEEYLDFLGGFGALNLGHNHPRITAAVSRHMKAPNLAQQSMNPYRAVLGANLSALTGDVLSVCAFTNSGTETVEEALKMALLRKKGAVLCCRGGYHGKTMGSASALGIPGKLKAPRFKGIFHEVPFGDFERLERTAKRYNASAFLVEPIQAEGGIRLPPLDYFRRVRELCTRLGITFILDEIQTGFGRCGSMFCCESYGVWPDILCLSKTLSGGIMPVGCALARRELWDETYGKTKYASFPSSTFGGNTLACVAGIETLSVLRDEELPRKAARLGEYAMSRLEVLRKRHPMITDVRGRGLLIGVEFGPVRKLLPKAAGEFMMTTVLNRLLREHRILCGLTSDPAVMRVEPPLTVTEAEIDRFAEALDSVLEEEDSRFRLLLDAAVTASRGYREMKELEPRAAL
ncbi:aspartate aminotransferase family protein [Papillibacter cinnamivorans]|uniref:Putrescine aminotransferase n=1 Tax=Papillibacter cinnamivorans DSM 12816 TaxID=1122930 RepID=A0A1W2C6G3_9FIRM|nr:aminotransferase class III-fold pyridoxal phosphate-dependent enzyme [Papillibacter cinnamivorans]SMC80711.1 putrescine aminotransferase [Papillibacter cinnamivorans DSM 12816]